MAKKRKSISTCLDELDRTMYASFCSTANSLSQLYSHAINHQKLSFNAGERHSLVKITPILKFYEKLYQWIWKQQEGGSKVASGDILNYIQNEIDYCGEEPSMSPRALPRQYQPQQPVMSRQGLCPEHCDNQSKNSVFSNALSSPVRHNLEHYQVGEEGCFSNGVTIGTNNRNTDQSLFHQQSRECTSFCFNDTAMDMHAD
ncbi:hypothetical protein PIB30_052753 [Stylosanthes scabra]|uniref:Uncharacterized protein n=1 Tax=Stylosanthes scabra TaxID=79078 RepID=A0ABU6XJM3_9FABA|nr:hypothetical protein [Stylosanthes scabra]